MPTITQTEAVKLLSNLPKSVKLELKRTPAGIKLTEQRTKQQFLEENYPRLRGVTISLSDAAQKYDIPRGTLKNWVQRSQYLAPIPGTSRPQLFNEAEIAMLADIYESRRAVGSKAPLLDDDGLPYELKHPDLAEYRRNKRN